MAISFNKLCSNVIPVGQYKAQVTDVKFKTSSTGSISKDILVKYTIIEGPLAKHTVLDTIYEKAFSFRLLPFLKACKVDTAREFATTEELYNFGIKEAKNKTLMISIGVRTYNGNEYNNVTDFTPIADSTTSSEDVLKEFDEDPVLKAVEVENHEATATFSEKPSEPSLGINIDLDTDVDPF